MKAQKEKAKEKEVIDENAELPLDVAPVVNEAPSSSQAPAVKIEMHKRSDAKNDEVDEDVILSPIDDNVMLDGLEFIAPYTDGGYTEVVIIKAGDIIDAPVMPKPVETPEASPPLVVDPVIEMPGLGPILPDGDVNMVTQAPLGASQPYAIGGLEDGSYVVIWHTYEEGNYSDKDIFGQRMGANGQPIGERFKVNTYTSYDQTKPEISLLDDGGFVVIWQSRYQDGFVNGIYGQRYDADGKQVGNEFQINTTWEGNQHDPHISALSDGGFVAVWTSYDINDPSYKYEGQDIYGQRFDADGNAVSDEFRINTETYSNQKDPEIAALNDGGFVVVWESYRQDGSNDGVFGQMFDADANPVAQEFQVNTETHWYQSEPTVTGLEGGGFVVTWTNFGFISAQMYDADGQQIGTEFAVSQSTEWFQHEPSITALKDGGFVITWTDLSPGDHGLTFDTIHAQRFDAEGNRIDEEFVFDGAIHNPEITALADGGFVISWINYDYGNSTIETQHFSPVESLDAAMDSNPYFEPAAMDNVLIDTSAVMDVV